MIGPPGISLALNQGPLDDPPTWTRIDDITGLLIESISIQRGRPDPRSKVSTANVSIKGKDTAGVLDAYNPSSPLFPFLNVVGQAAVSLYRPDLGQWHWLVRGLTAEITGDYDVSERWTEFEITFNDALDLLNDAEIIPDGAGNAVPYESQGDCYYTGQHVDDRLLAVLADASVAFAGQTWPATLIQLATGNVFVQGRAYASRTSLLQVVDEAVDAEYPYAASRYITRNGAFRFSGRFYRFTPDHFTAASDADRAPGHRLVHWQVGDEAAAADPSIMPVNGLTIKENKDELINAALITPVGIGTQVLANNTFNNFVSDGTSVGKYGVRTDGTSYENLITSDGDDHNDYVEETATYSDAVVNNYKDPVQHVDTITVKTPSEGDGATQVGLVWDFLTGVELSDLITVTTFPAAGGGFNPTTVADQDHFVESLDYEITALQGDTWMTTLKVVCSSRHHFRYMPAAWSILAGAPPATQARFIWTSSAPRVYDFFDESSGAVSWDWDWGDGTTHGTGFLGVTHTYASPGTYTVTLTITDISSGTSSASHVIVVA